MRNILRHVPLLGTAVAVALMGVAILWLYIAGAETKPNRYVGTAHSSYNAASMAQAELPSILAALSLGESGYTALTHSLNNLVAISNANVNLYPKESHNYSAFESLGSSAKDDLARILKYGMPTRRSNFEGMYSTLESEILTLR